MEHGWNGKSQGLGDLTKVKNLVVLKLGLKLRLSHPSLVSRCPLKNHEQTDTDRGTSICQSAFHQVPQKVLQDEDVRAREIVRHGSHEKAGRESRTGWEGSKAGA